MWQDSPDMPKEMNWDDAMKYAQNLRLVGYDDWRLPTKNELEDLYNKKSNLEFREYDKYWSSSIYDSHRAWFMAFYRGYTENLDKTYTKGIRCVRGGQ
jgi:hypothetical protein